MQALDMRENETLAVELRGYERRLFNRVLAGVPSDCRSHLSGPEATRAFSAAYPDFKRKYDTINWIALPIAIVLLLAMFAINLPMPVRVMLLIPLTILCVVSMTHLQGFKNRMRETLTAMAERNIRNQRTAEAE